MKHATTQATASQPGETPLSILVIDDDPVALELTTRSLTRQGYQVVTARGGEEGLRLAREVRPMAILLDVVMPDKDGWAVLAALKNDPELTHIPVFMVTMMDERNKGFALGVTDYLLKPFNKTYLANLLTKIRGKKEPGQVLIVDDDSANRDILQRMLLREGWKAVTAENGLIALELATRTPPDLILLDLMMPVMDGFTFAAELRKNPSLQAIPIVVLTAKELTLEDQARLNGSVRRVLQKGSCTPNDLRAEIRLSAKMELAGSEKKPATDQHL
jgi:CheY-like chemotaxis protein